MMATPEVNLLQHIIKLYGESKLTHVHVDALIIILLINFIDRSWSRDDGLIPRFSGCDRLVLHFVDHRNRQEALEFPGSVVGG